jgi:hypothetical protein
LEGSNIQTKAPFDAAIPPPATNPKELKSMYERNIFTPMFTADLFVVTRYGSNLSIHKQRNG